MHFCSFVRPLTDVSLLLLDRLNCLQNHKSISSPNLLSLTQDKSACRTKGLKSTKQFLGIPPMKQLVQNFTKLKGSSSLHNAFMKVEATKSVVLEQLQNQCNHVTNTLMFKISDRGSCRPLTVESPVYQTNTCFQKSNI